MKKVKEFLSGKKTYIVMAAFLLTVVCEYMGWPVPDNLKEALAGLGLITLRSGVAKH